ncbi:MAG: hypothetical protein FJ318_07140 [SAR202 cluster bacterium]|nr:hypothetical protein [SAR202 cluster bacterium]
MEAKHLMCTIYTKDFGAECSFFEPMGFRTHAEFHTPSGEDARIVQAGAGLIEVIHHQGDPRPGLPWEVSLVVDDVEPWHKAVRRYKPSEIVGMPWGVPGFTVKAPTGPEFWIYGPRPGLEAPLAAPRDPNGPNVLHFQITWWAKKWEEDYEFLTKGLGFVTSRGRGSPKGNRIAFTRAAYDGRAIVEVVDGLYDQHPGPGLHWLISLPVDSAADFHRRMVEAGQMVSPLGMTRWGVPSFSARTATGPLLFVYQERPGGTPGMVGEPAGLTMV